MKKSFFQLFTFALLTLANTTYATNFHFDDDFVTLPMGTTVSLQVNEEINSDDFFVGNAIDFMVRSNVVVNGKVVIAAGTFAEGTITAVKNSCNGQCPEITISVDNVQAVDGQRVNLNGKPHKIKARCCNSCGNEGAQAVIPMGTSVAAKVFDNIDIDG